MLLVVLGAGSSHDSLPIDAWSPEMRSPTFDQFQPPLAAQLFKVTARPQVCGQAMDQYGEAALIEGLAEKLDRAANANRSIEEGLEEVAAASQAGDPRATRQLIGMRFYIESVISRSATSWLTMTNHRTNFSALIDTIERLRFPTGERVIFVTFNYDTLLEDALERELGLRFESPADYISDDRNYVVFKVHGSIRWARRCEPLANWGQDVATLLTRGAEVQLEDRDSIHPHEFGAPSDGVSPLVPAIAVPVRTKLGFECPSEHERLLASVMRDVTRVLCIGWRAQERHFMRMLETVCRLGANGGPGGTPYPIATRIVSANHGEASQIADTLRKDLNPVPSTAPGFSAFVGDDAEVRRAWEGARV